MKLSRIENPNMGLPITIGKQVDHLASLKRSIEESQISIERSQAAIAWSLDAIALLNRLQERENSTYGPPRLQGVCRDRG